ncbi:NAD(P)/FAD-dependent oxidoreductase [Cognatishimia maritima]|uniref:D-amino-acid dehydrogenase n=1 Tax=Cognatishimia maritima TaxID=870908 RepID=A0A1M5WKK5_9RHOB|nr:FAD-binding oxidoreductase [Cognatishimia maritima]SHH87704.1 D-amino-acid dehydrogenase [Cognatishimia maritima]
MTETVTVVGAGLVGICTALSLAERNFTVRIIDKDAPAQGATYGNAGIISPWSVLPQAVPGIWKSIPGLMLGRHQVLKARVNQFPKLIPWGISFLRNTSPSKVERVSEAMSLLCNPSIELYRRHLKGTDHEDFLADSWYVHAFRSETKARRWDKTAIDYSMRRKFGAEIEFVADKELHEIEPALGPEFKAAVLIKNQARARSPEKIALALLNKAQKLGVTFERGEMQALYQTGDGWVVQCKDRQFSSQKLVLATGAWSAKLLRPLGISLPLLAERGYHVDFKNPGVSIQNSVMDIDAKVVASSMSGGLRLAGASEFCRIDAQPDANRQALMTRQAKAIAPELNTSTVSFWHGHRPSFPDSLPMVGEFNSHPNLFASFGHSHYGLMMAPKSGEILADLLEGRTHNMDVSAFRTNRFE